MAARRGQGRGLDLSVSEREVKKREKKEMISAQLAEAAKQEALKDDKNAFSVVIGAKTSTLEGSSCLSISQALNKKLHLFFLDHHFSALCLRMLCAVSAYENERAQTLKWSCRVIILTILFSLLKVRMAQMLMQRISRLTVSQCLLVARSC